MPDNRSDILTDQEVLIRASGVDDSELDSVTSGNRLAAGPIRLKRGPLRKAIPPNNTALVITRGGEYERTLVDQTVFTYSFNPLFKLEQYVVDMKPRTLELESKDDFLITYEDSSGVERTVTIALTMQIRYVVEDPEFVVRRGGAKPLAELFDRAIESIRAEVNSTDYSTFVKHGLNGDRICTRLREFEKQDKTGIRVNSVRFSRIAGNGILVDIEKRNLQTTTDMDLSGYVKDRERSENKRHVEHAIEIKKLEVSAEIENTGRIHVAKLRQQELAASTWRFLADTTGEDIRTMMFLEDREVLLKLISGEQSLKSEQARILIAMAEHHTLSSLPLSNPESTELIARAFNILPDRATSSIKGTSPHPQIDGQEVKPEHWSTNAHSRLNADISELEQFYDDVRTKSIPDQGIESVRVREVDPIENYELNIYLRCKENYPVSAPEVTVFRDGEQVDMELTSLLQWNEASQLHEIVDEIISLGNSEEPDNTNVVRFS